LLFAAGELRGRLEELGQALREHLPEVPILVAGGHGVLTERGELEQENAVCGMVWTGGEAESLVAPPEADVGSALSRALESRATPRATAFVFARPRNFHPHAAEPLATLRFGAFLGGGTAGDGQVLALAPGREPALADSGALVSLGLRPPVVTSSPACRLLMPLARITEVRGSMVLELEGERALDVLAASAEGLVEEPLVFVALAREDAEDDEPAELLVRGIQGVDPAERGVVISEEVRPGMRMAFAVRDAAAARLQLEGAVQRLARDIAGAAPLFAIYVSCAGRGVSLHGTPDVDLRIIRARFPDIPIAGMHSSYEIAPHGDAPALKLYTGVLALFTMPS